MIQLRPHVAFEPACGSQIYCICGTNALKYTVYVAQMLSNILYMGHKYSQIYCIWGTNTLKYIVYVFYFQLTLQFVAKQMTIAFSVVNCSGSKRNAFYAIHFCMHCMGRCFNIA